MFNANFLLLKLIFHHHSKMGKWYLHCNHVLDLLNISTGKWLMVYDKI